MSGVRPGHEAGSDRPTGPGAGGAGFEGPARRLGRFELRRLIGAGGMGLVYEALQDNPSRVVVVKVMNPLLATAESFARFEREVRILASLRHPGIAQVYEAGSAEEAGVRVLFYAMEFIPGARPLTAYAQERGLGTAARLELFVSVCEAAHHAHERGVVHRDLKPANILVDLEGRAKLIDFGVARGPDSDRAPEAMATRAGELVGTLRYMAPEQCGPDARRVDRRTDVYALGLVLHELLTGRAALEVGGQDPVEAVRRVREVDPAALGSIDATLAGDLETIVRKATDKQADHRYASTLELGEDVRRYLRDEPIVARPVSASGRALRGASRAARRRPVAAWLGAVGGATLLARFVGDPIVFEWTPASHWAQRAVDTVAPGPGMIDRLRSVRLVTLGDGMDVARVAGELGLEGVDEGDPPSLRRLHARLVDRLVESGAKVIVFDLVFYDPADHDEALAGAIERAVKAGAPVIVGSESWATDESGMPPLSSAIVHAASAWGGVTIGDDGGALCPVDLIVRQGSTDATPSIALAAAAAVRAPGWSAVYAIDDLRETVEARFWRPSPRGGGARVWREDTDLVRLAGVRLLEEEEPDFGLRRGAYVGVQFATIPEDSVMRGATIDATEALLGSAGALTRAVAGKAVVVGDERDGRDQIVTGRARSVPGCWAHACAIESLLRREFVRAPGEREEWATSAIGSALGGSAVSLGRGRWARVVLWVVALCALSFCVSAVFLMKGGLVLNPAGGIIAIVLGALVVGGLRFVRGARV